MNRYTFAAKKYWPLLLGFNALVCGAAATNLMLTPKAWKADAELIIPNETSNLNADLGEIGTLNKDSLTYSQQLSPLKIVGSILGSDTVMSSVRDIDPEKEDFARIQAYKQLFTISPKSETTVIELSVNASSPELAEIRLKALIETFQQRLVTLREDETTRRSEFALKELEAATDALQVARTNLASFQTNASIVDGGAQTAGIIKTLGDLTNSQAQSIAQAQAERALAGNLSDQLSLSSEQALNLLRLNENKDYQFIQQELSETEAELVERQALFTDEHPEVAYLLDQRDELRTQLNQYVGQVPNIGELADISVGDGTSELIQQLVVAETQATAFEQQAQQLQLTIDQLNSDLLTLPGKQANLDGLQQEYEAAKATYRGLTAQLQEAKLSAFGAYPVIQVLDQPAADLRPSSPNKKFVGTGAMLACLAGTGALMLLLVSRDSLLSSEELLTTDLEILGRVPKLKADDINAGSNETQLMFQRLASAVSVLPIQNRRLLITSAGEGEGKTTVSTGLASGLTTLGFKVLLVEGNFQKRDLRSAVINNQNSPIPIDERMSQQPISANVMPISASLDFLTIDFQDELDAARLVARGEFDRILTQTQRKENYDYVIIDGAAVNENYAMALVAKAAVNVLMVTRPGMSKSLPFREGLEQLAWYGTQVLGLVVNAGDAPVRRSVDYAYGSYGGNYGNGYANEGYVSSSYAGGYGPNETTIHDTEPSSNATNGVRL
ncbi:MAG: AAA family ATPase [Cyanobacteria bacterium J06649_5]